MPGGVRRWIRLGAATVGAVAVGIVATAAVAMRRWDGDVARHVSRLRTRTLLVGARPPERFTPEQIAGLPAPVVRYFAAALTPGQALIARAQVRQTGEFAMRRGAWSPFTATQVYTVMPPGFLWDASIRLARVIRVRVRDSYSADSGGMLGRVAALMTVVEQQGTRAMAVNNLQRYLVEAPWLPTALLPSAGVVWTAIDGSTARATLADAGLTVSVDFHFGLGGEIVGMSTERYRDAHGASLLTRWVGRFWRYERAGA